MFILFRCFVFVTRCYRSGGWGLLTSIGRRNRMRRGHPAGNALCQMCQWKLTSWYQVIPGVTFEAPAENWQIRHETSWLQCLSCTKRCQKGHWGEVWPLWPLCIRSVKKWMPRQVLQEEGQAQIRRLAFYWGIPKNWKPRNGVFPCFP